MMYPLVRELAVDGIPVTVTCRVLEIARAPYYRWLEVPVTSAELSAAYRANALFDAHRDDPLANLQLTEPDFAWATAKIAEVAHKHAGGRLVSMLEGGYNLAALARSVAVHVGMLMEAGR